MAGQQEGSSRYSPVLPTIPALEHIPALTESLINPTAVSMLVSKCPQVLSNAFNLSYKMLSLRLLEDLFYLRQKCSSSSLHIIVSYPLTLSLLGQQRCAF